MIKCPKCDTENPEIAAFCIECRTPLKKKEPTPGSGEPGENDNPECSDRGEPVKYESPLSPPEDEDEAPRFESEGSSNTDLDSPCYVSTVSHTTKEGRKIGTRIAIIAGLVCILTVSIIYALRSTHSGKTVSGHIADSSSTPQKSKTHTSSGKKYQTTSMKNSAEKLGKQVVVTAYKVNVRSFPEIKRANIIGRLEKGDVKTITNIENKAGRDWYQIRIGDTNAWISSKVCRVLDRPLSPITSYLSGSSATSNPSAHLKNRYPEEYNALHQKLKHCYSNEELDRLFSSREVTVIDDAYWKKLRFLASPLSIKKQKAKHKNWLPILVNDKTVNKGFSFYKENLQYFRTTYQKTGVAPSDIIAILNWESRFGKYRGKFNVLKTFTAQYFYIDSVERDLYENGAYNVPDTMNRPDALKRIAKLKRRALSNLSQLLIQSKMVGFNPLLVKGSWAGAIGIPQFMPASMSYAADGNGDGVIDLNSMPDAIMSIASFLSHHRYHKKGKKYAIRRYNPQDDYVNGVMMYSERVEKLGARPNKLMN